MKLSAQIIHTAPGRIRFKVPAKRHDEKFFSELKIDCSSYEGVQQVSANALTGSVLLLFDITQQDALIKHLKKQPLLDFESKEYQFRESGMVLTTTERDTATQKTSNSFSSVDATLREFSNGYLDLRSVLFISLVMFATRQLTQGAVFGNAISMFWYAIQLIRTKKP